MQRAARCRGFPGAAAGGRARPHAHGGPHARHAGGASAPVTAVRRSCAALAALCWAQVFHVATGALLTQLRQGHFEPITACAWSALTQQLYTAGSDGAVLAWAPRVAVPIEEDELLSWRARNGGSGGGLPDWAIVDEDAWSDDY